MKLKQNIGGIALGLAAALCLAACGSNTEPATANDAMMSAGNDAMSASPMNSGDPMASDDAMATGDAMASGNAMAKGGNDAMAADAPKQ